MKTVSNFWEAKAKTGQVRIRLVLGAIVDRFVKHVRLAHISTTMGPPHVCHVKTNLKTHFILKLQCNKLTVLTIAIVSLKMPIQIHYV